MEEPEGTMGTKETRLSKHSRTYSHMDSQRLRLSVWGLHESTPDGTLELTLAQSLIRKKSPNDNHMQMKNPFFSQEVSLGIQTTLKASHHVLQETNVNALLVRF